MPSRAVLKQPADHVFQDKQGTQSQPGGGAAEPRLDSPCPGKEFDPVVGGAPLLDLTV